MHFIDIKFTDFLKLNLIEIATIAIKILLDWSSVSNDPKTNRNIKISNALGIDN